jgi:hypothetical protein
MSTLKQIEANRRNSQLSTGPTSPAGKAVSCMNALKTGIDAQSQIITGEDPEALERLTSQYYDRHQPQGPEEAALIDSAIASDWLLRRLRQTEAQIWNRSITEHAADLRKWGQKAEAYPLAAAFRDQQKVFERLQRRISAAERSLRASLESFTRLRKQAAVGQAPRFAGPSRISPGNDADQSLPPEPSQPSVTPSNLTPKSEFGSVPEILPGACADPAPQESDAFAELIQEVEQEDSHDGIQQAQDQGPLNAECELLRQQSPGHDPVEELVENEEEES